MVQLLEGLTVTLIAHSISLLFLVLVIHSGLSNFH